MIITILRKPLEGSVADNTLKHGCGAINLDATRISTDDRIVRGANPHNKNPYSNEIVWSGSSTPKIEYSLHNEGRWPANFILNHKEGCELKGTKKVKGHKNSNGMTNQGFGANGVYGKANPTKCFDYTDEDGNEEIADWDCVEGCPVKELDQQSGILKSGGRSSKYYADTNSDRAVYTWKGKNGVSKELKPSVGGASRFFKQFQKENNQ